jgi:glycosyltransferase involved in cell wall biosynthesis
MISVVMCSHSPRPEYMAESLEALRLQSLPQSRWELVVVDNASNPPLSDLIDVSWHAHGRIVREEKLGLTHARLRGIGETGGSLVVFVDDDNILDHDYLETAERIAATHTHLGAWGGQSRPRFEADPPAWTKRFWGNLVIRDVERDSWSNLYDMHETLPTGAGLCVRREVADHYSALHATGRRAMILDRAGAGLLSGGDTDLALCSLDIGLGSGTFSSLRLIHIIPSGRLDEKYLIDLAAGIAYSAVILKSFRPDKYPPETQPGTARRVANALRAFRRNRLERRLHSALRDAESRAKRDLAAHTIGKSA